MAEIIIADCREIWQIVSDCKEIIMADCKEICMGVLKHTARRCI